MARNEVQIGPKDEAFVAQHAAGWPEVATFQPDHCAYRWHWRTFGWHRFRASVVAGFACFEVERRIVNDFTVRAH